MMPKVEEVASHLKVLRSYVAGKRNIRFKGQKLTFGDQMRLGQFFGYLYLVSCDLFGEGGFSLTELIGDTEFDVYAFAKECKAFDTRIKHYGYLFEVNSYMASLFGAEAWECVRSDAEPLNVVRDMRRSRFSAFYEPLIASKTLWRYWQGCASYADDFRRISTWLNFILRSRLDDIDLLTDQIIEYTDFEKGLRARDVDNDDYVDCLMLAAEELEEMIPEDFDYKSCFRPKHGPGAIQERPGRWSAAAKTSMLHVSPELALPLAECGIYWETYIPNSLCSLDYADTTDTRIVDVPKSLYSRRIISIEHVERQYAQQGVKSVCDSILALPSFAAYCDLSDQTVSQKLARLGSASGMYDTADLSSASDSVTCDIVRRITNRRPWLQKLLFAVRPEIGVLPDGTRIPLEKFAPMGSGHCFRAEVIVFIALCRVAYRVAPSAVRRKVDKIVNTGLPMFKVFGDDIVILRELMPYLLYVLRSTYFIVNMDKSFFGSDANSFDMWRFREACGGEYLDGIDVTPLRIPRQMGLLPGLFSGMPVNAGLSRRFRAFASKKEYRPQTGSPNALSAIMDFINAAFNANCIYLRAGLIADMRVAFRKTWIDGILFAPEVTTCPSLLTFYQYATNPLIERRSVKDRKPNKDPRKPNYQELEMYITSFWATESKEREELDPRVISYAASINSELQREHEDYCYYAPDYCCITRDDFQYFEWLRARSGHTTRPLWWLSPLSVELIDDSETIENPWYVPILHAGRRWQIVDSVHFPVFDREVP